MELGELTVRLSRIEECAHKARVTAIDVAILDARKPALAVAQGVGGNLNGALHSAGQHEAERAGLLERMRGTVRQMLDVVREEAKQLEAVK